MQIDIVIQEMICPVLKGIHGKTHSHTYLLCWKFSKNPLHTWFYQLQHSLSKWGVQCSLLRRKWFVLTKQYPWYQPRYSQPFINNYHNYAKGWGVLDFTTHPFVNDAKGWVVKSNTPYPFVNDAKRWGYWILPPTPLSMMQRGGGYWIQYLLTLYKFSGLFCLRL